MAMKVEELQVLISANADQFRSELTKIQGSLNMLNNHTNKVSNSVGNNLFGSMVQANVIGNIMTATIGRLTSGIGSMIQETLAGGSALQRLRVANSVVTANMGLTSQAVQQLRDDLADANTYGIAAENIISSLALSGLVDLAQNLKYVDGRSGEAAEGVTALTLAIKDLSAARGLDSVVGIERISKFIQSGRTELVDGLIEIGEINREYAAYATQIGKQSAEQLSQLERAQVRLNIVMEEGAKSFGAYAATYNSSGKIFSSVKMLITSIKDEIGSNLEPILRVGSLAFLEFFRGIADAVTGASGAIQNFANKVAGYMVAVIRLIGKLGSSLPFVGAGFRRLAEFTLQPIKANGSLQQSLGGTQKEMDETGKSAKKLQKDLMGLAGFDELNIIDQGAAGGGAGADAGDISGGGGGIIGGGGDTGGFADTTKEIMEYANQAEGVFKKVGDAIDSFLKPLREIKIFGVPVIDILGDIAKYAGIALLAFKVLSPIVGLVAAAIGAITSPVTLAVLAIAGLIAIFVAAYNNSEQFRNFIDELAATIQDVLVEAFNILGEVVTYVWENIIQPAFMWFQENVAPTIGEIVAKLQEMVAIFVERFPEIQAAIEPLVQSIGNFLAGAFQLLGKIIDWVWKNVLKPLIDFVLANIVPAFNMFLDILIFAIGIFSQVASTVLDIVMPVLNALWDTFTTVFEGIRSIVEFVWDNILKPIFTAVYDIVTKLIIPVIKNLLVIWGHIFNGIRQIAENVWNGIMNVVRPVIDWFNNNIMPVINKVKDGIEQAFNKIKDTAMSIWDGIKQGFKNGINGVIEFVNGFIRKINGLIEGVNSVATKIPGVSAIEFRVGEIPKLATGGVITSPTIAAMGEGSYKEAVLPLDRNTEWANTVAELIRDAGGNTPGQQTIVLQIGDEKIYEKVIDYINDQSVASGMTVLNI